MAHPYRRTDSLLQKKHIAPPETLGLVLVVAQLVPKNSREALNRLRNRFKSTIQNKVRIYEALCTDP